MAEAAGEPGQPIPPARVGVRRGGLQGRPGLFEHRVDQGGTVVEVAVGGHRGHAQVRGEAAHRQAGETVLLDDLEGGGEDRRAVETGTRGHRLHPWRCGLDIYVHRRRSDCRVGQLRRLGRGRGPGAHAGRSAHPDPPSRGDHRMTTEVVVGVALILVAVAFNVAFARLASAFEYPDILRREPGEILTRFSAGGTGLVLRGWTFMIVGVAFVPVAVAVASLVAPGTTVGAVATALRIAAGLVQTLGLARWPFLVPELARRHAAATTDEARGSVELVFAAVHRLLGVGIGEHLGYLLTAAWTLALSGRARHRGEPRRPGLAGDPERDRGPMPSPRSSSSGPTSAPDRLDSVRRSPGPRGPPGRRGTGADRFDCRPARRTRRSAATTRAASRRRRDSMVADRHRSADGASLRPRRSARPPGRASSIAAGSAESTGAGSRSGPSKVSSTSSSYRLRSSCWAAASAIGLGRTQPSLKRSSLQGSASLL